MALVVEQEVGRLDVAVHQPATVGVVKAAARLEPHLQRLGRRGPEAAVDLALEAAALEQLGDEERRAAVVAPVVDQQHVGVAQGGGDLGLGLEAAEEGVVGGQGRVQHLDGHLPAEDDVVGGDPRGRGAGTEHGGEPVATAQHPAHEIGGRRRG